MKPRVDEDKCIGCGACVAIAPNNFDFNEEGLSTVIGEEVTDETRNAVDACPVYAITIEEKSVKKEEVKEEKKEEVKEEEQHECKCHGNHECIHECKCEHHACENDEEDEELKEAA